MAQDWLPRSRTGQIEMAGAWLAMLETRAAACLLQAGMEHTRRRSDVLEFGYNNSAMICYICIRYENAKGEAGPLWPMASAVIP